MINKDEHHAVVIHRKKSFSIFPSSAVMSLTELSLGGNNLYEMSLFPPRESLVSDIPAGDLNIIKFFYSVRSTNLASTATHRAGMSTKTSAGTLAI
jgi:hypothetical protein